MGSASPDSFAEELESVASDPFLSLKRGATEVYLIRHGDALPAAEEVVEGGYDAQALSELGRRQVQALAAALANLSFGAVYSSPIARARATAAPLATARGLELLIDPELREVELGTVGMDILPDATPDQRAEAIRARLREIAVIALGTGRWESIPGSESSQHLRERITQAVDAHAAQHPGTRIAIVTHGGAINAYIAAKLGLASDYFFPAANTSISAIRVRGDRHLLMALNDIAHLRSAGLFGPREA